MELWSQRRISVLAQLYDNNSALQYTRGKRLIDEHLKPQPGQVILDIGCGTGRLISYIASKMGDKDRIVGVDPNEERLKIARRAVSSYHSNAQFITGKIEDAINAGPYDSVFANLVLHWIPDEHIESTLKAIYASLKPGGRLVANVTYSTGALINAISVAVTGQEEPAALGYMCLDESSWVDLLRSTGFEIVISSFDDDVRFPFESITALFDFIKAYSMGKIDGHQLNSNALEGLLYKFKIENADLPLEIHTQISQLVAQKPLH